MIEDKITNAAPIKVLYDGISFQTKYPKKMAKTKLKYFNGETKETSESLYDWPKSKFATPPNKPMRHNNIKSIKVGITHPNGTVNKPKIEIDNEKYNEISQIGSEVDNCLIAIAT